MDPNRFGAECNSDMLSGLLDAFATQVARAVVAELRSGDWGDYIDQGQSPLGSRRHCAAVRRRIASGDGSACIVGRRYLLRPEALRSELTASSKPAKRGKPEAKPSVREELEAELGLRLVGGVK